MATYLLKAGDEDMARWKAEAAREGLSFAAWIRQKLDGSSRPRSAPTKGCPRAHFHRVGVLCKTCGTTA